jgi:DNA-binding transcriptional LysR family regulator
VSWRAEAKAASAAALMRAASAASQDIAGSVRLSASEVITVEVLPPMLALLREQHPRFTLEPVVSNGGERPLAPGRGPWVRNVRPTQTGLVARKIGEVAPGLHAHRRYLKRHATPRSVDDLGVHALIGYDQETPAVRSLQTQKPALFPQHVRTAHRQPSRPPGRNPRRLWHRYLPGAHWPT